MEYFNYNILHYFQSLQFRNAVILRLTCLKDLISDGESCSVGLIIRHKLDEQLISRGNDRRGGDFPTVLPYKLTALVHAVSHLHVVIPEMITTEAVLLAWCRHRESQET